MEVAGRTLLEITLSRLKSFGISEVVINVHYLADMIVEYLKANQSFGLSIEVSREEVLLDTGGGLKKASWFLFGNDSDEPFILHNVDVISTIDLKEMAQFHSAHGALATLAVQERKSSRYLLFDEQLQLCGREFSKDQKKEIARPSQQVQALAFSGVHIISPRLFPLMIEEGVFSIISSYLRLASQNEKVLAFRADEYYWKDLGRAEDLAQATRDIKGQAVLPS